MNIEQAKQIPLEDFLRRLGFAPRREIGNQIWYSSPFRNEATPSFKVNRSLNAWYDFGRGQGGDIIDLVMELEGLRSVSETLVRIDEIVGAATFPLRTQQKFVDSDLAPALELIRIGPVRSRSLLAYLRDRGIDPRIARPYIQEVEYRRGNDYYSALAFANRSGGYELRNPGFKGTLAIKDISIIEGSHDRVLVFEGFFDFLTAVMMNHGEIDATALVLNSVNLREKAADAIRKMNPSIVEVYRDHDSAGEQLIDFFQNTLPTSKVIDKSETYHGHNDLNDWHVINRISMSPEKRSDCLTGPGR